MESCKSNMYLQDITQVMEDNKGLMYKQLHKFGYIDDPEAQSIALEALWRAASTYEKSKAAFSTYASVVIYNALGSYGRKCMCDRTEPHEDMDIIHTESTETTVLERDAYEQTSKTIQSVLSTFKGKQHRILEVWLSDLEQTNTEVAEIAESSQSYVSMTINEYRDKLRKYLEGR